MKYYIDVNGNYLGGWDTNPPEGAIEVTHPPYDARDVWDGIHWVPSKAQLETEARVWRDEELARADIELNKVQDGDGVGTVTAWRAYRSALRKWPETLDCPNSIKPIAPDYKE